MHSKIVPNSLHLLLLLLLFFIFHATNGSPPNLHQNHSSNGTMVHGHNNGTHGVGKRPHHKSLFQLAEGSVCTLLSNGHWAWHNLLNIWNWKFWTGYGCFCGFGTRGNVPVDAIDECCQIHDQCYQEYNVKWQAECTWIPYSGVAYIKSYTYTCDSTMNCHADQNKPCEQFLCECDKKVIDCFLKQPAPTEMKQCP